MGDSPLVVIVESGSGCGKPRRVREDARGGANTGANAGANAGTNAGTKLESTAVDLMVRYYSGQRIAAERTLSWSFFRSRRTSLRGVARARGVRGRFRSATLDHR